MAYLHLKHYGVNLHGVDMRDTYTNSIINDNDVVILKHKMNRIRWHMLS